MALTEDYSFTPRDQQTFFDPYATSTLNYEVGAR